MSSYTMRKIRNGKEKTIDGKRRKPVWRGQDIAGKGWMMVEISRIVDASGYVIHRKSKRTLCCGNFIVSGQRVIDILRMINAREEEFILSLGSKYVGNSSSGICIFHSMIRSL